VYKQALRWRWEKNYALASSTEFGPQVAKIALCLQEQHFGAHKWQRFTYNVLTSSTGGGLALLAHMWQ